ncbi:GNAT family N-acetyltransferase [Christiangramia sp.]|uniref:GNAT family N-acetyltransferase n=1 Tax=Christiangramia sp. TaxID=1931228 RepID=UPI00262EF6DC|nr:GNAT family N-acetyltransferase [Christiangramia sp.]
MLIREATNQDIPNIVRVLKASLGEDELALSEEIWKYKHVNNPFGESLVLLAEENNEIVGVRAFMRWRWQQGTKQFSALRAVDTATHPEHQGKGIFKKLTLKAVELVREDGDHFIFNTPNAQSRPGYLKMGWKTVGKINVGLRPSLSFILNRINQKTYSTCIEGPEQGLEDLCQFWNNRMEDSGNIFTPKSPEYLKWRYHINPLQSYEIFYKDGLYLAGYVKRRKGLKEFRISECLFKNLSRRDLTRQIKEIERKFGCHLISFSPQTVPLTGKKGFFGPILTLNNLNLSGEDVLFFSDINRWNNTLGDLELF